MVVPTADSGGGIGAVPARSGGPGPAAADRAAAIGVVVVVIPPGHDAGPLVLTAPPDHGRREVTRFRTTGRGTRRGAGLEVCGPAGCITPSSSLRPRVENDPHGG